MSTFTRAMTCVALASVITLTGCQKEDLMNEQFSPNGVAASPNNGKAIEGQYIVVFKNGNGLSAVGVGNLSTGQRAAFTGLRERLISNISLEKTALQQTYEGAVNGFAARLTASQVEQLRKNPEVAYVEQDQLIMLGKPTTSGSVKTTGKGGGKKTDPAPTPTEPAPTEPTPTEPVPTEPAPTEPTPSEPTPAYTKITPAAGEVLPWSVSMTGYGDGTGKTVWVIDSGVDTDHPDLNVDLARSKSFIYNVTSFEDGFGHGTSVAGVIAAKNNGSGIIGVASNATVVALRVFDDAGAGTVSRAINAVNHVLNNAQPGDVVNMSLGSGVSSTLDNAVMNAAAKGILFSLAAGNSAVDCSTTSPARVNAPGVYTISAMDSYQRLWASSNYGAGVDYAAPGVNITVSTIGGGYASGANGTSFAAPHVAGILLLRGTIYSHATITGDKDSTPDPIASVE